jgi:hypothetical protein
MMNRAYKVQRITALGYKVNILPERKPYIRIKAIKDNKIITGTVNHVFKELFGY